MRTETVPSGGMGAYVHIDAIACDGTGAPVRMDAVARGGTGASVRSDIATCRGRGGDSVHACIVDNTTAGFVGVDKEGTEQVCLVKIIDVVVGVKINKHKINVCNVCCCLNVHSNIYY